MSDYAKLRAIVDPAFGNVVVDSVDVGLLLNEVDKLRAGIASNSAFPSHGAMGEIVDRGMSMREYYAAHAPAIPDWFKYQSFVAMPPSAPTPLHLTTVQRSEVVDMLGELAHIHYESTDPQVLEFVRQFKEAKAAKDKWRDEQREPKFFAWRWHYADMMIAGGEK